MVFKNIKKIISMALVVSILIPTINVQALDNLNDVNTEVIQTINEEDLGNLEQEELSEEVEVNSNETQSSEENLNNSEVEVEENADLNSEENIETNVEENIETEVETNASETQDDNESLKGKVYSKVKLTDVNAKLKTFSMASSIVVDEPEEYKIKKAEIEELELLVTMTDSDYELAIANSDGSYEYVDSYDEFNEAKEAAVSLSRSGDLDSSQLPAVVSYTGAVVYSTNQMGRMIISRNNAIFYSGVVNLYPTSDLNSPFTYANVGSMEDVPVLDMTDKAAKIMVNGHIGWISNDISSGNYNMKLVPLNQATNPSYYTVKNGDLLHFLSYNLEGTTGVSLVIGKAPSYLQEGVKYLSYDGNYFYEYTSNNLSSQLNNLINDYRSGSRMASTNRSNPFYNYYQYLPFRSTTVYTADELNNYIVNNTASNSKLRGLGASLKQAESKYGVNALLILGVAINESGRGTSNIALTKNNLFGMAAYDSDTDAASSYTTPGDSVLDFARNFISGGYADPADWRYYGGFLGTKDRGANVKYASDPYWGEKAAQYAYEIDKYLSGGTTNLRDTNSKQIGMATANNTVIKKDGTVLYNITTNLNQYASYVKIPFIINDLQKVTINNNSYYEINPEITKPLYSGSNMNNFNGDYDWNTKGYVLAENITLLNVYVPSITKEYGSTRYETSVEVSKSQFTTSDTVVLVNGYAVIDGVSATPLAAGLNAPILLTETNFMTDSVKNEIKRLGAKNVVIVGGAGVVTSNVESQLRSLGVTKITRLGGSTRYDTSLEVAKYIDANLYNVERIVVTAGEGEADALSISSVAGSSKMPILLVKLNEVTPDVAAWIRAEDIQDGYVIGGSGVVSDNVLNSLNGMIRNDISNNRLGGSTRYDTNAKVIERFYGSVINKAYITVGDPLADSLSAGVVAALNDSPVILAAKDLSVSQKDVLKNRTVNSIVQVGGTVSSKAVQSLKDALSRAQ